MLQKYSRLQSVEEKRNLRNAVILLAISLITIILLVFYGIPLVGRVAGFVSGLRGGNSPINSGDKTPPAPPKFNTFTDFTNQQYITLGGTAEPGAKVKMTFDGTDQETVVDKDGNFSFPDLKLTEGENSFSAIAMDGAGNLSQKSSDGKVIYDIKPPDLNIDNPGDGTKFFGSTQRQINIQGTTEASASVTINDRIVTVSDDGHFSYPVTLNSGDNTFTIKATDQASNTTEKQITLNFSE